MSKKVPVVRIATPDAAAELAGLPPLSVIMVVAASSEVTFEQGEIREEACPLLPLR